MADFHEVRLPVSISYGAEGGPKWRTDVVTLSNGFEERNSPWAHGRHEYDIGYGTRNMQTAADILDFYHARRGPLYGFRYKDWADYKSCQVTQTITDDDQIIGTGNGSLTQFQLVKKYNDTILPYTRIITKPVAGTVVVSVNGAAQASGWTVNTATGIITFSVAPTSGHVIRAGFEFDVPVRFVQDQFTINLANFNMGSVQNIPLIEVKV